MPGLTNYLNNLEQYSGRMQDYIQGKVKVDFRTAKAVEVLAPLVKNQGQLLQVLVASPPIAVPVVMSLIDFPAILDGVKQEIVAQYGKYNNPELSPDNEFMIYAHAERRAVLAEIATIDEALEWNGFLKPLCDEAFLHVVGSESVYCHCSSCKESANKPPCYTGQVPKNIQEVIDVQHVLRKLKIPYAAGLWMCADELKMMKARIALLTLQSRNYQIAKGDAWMRRAWTCGLLAIDKVDAQSVP